MPVLNRFVHYFPTLPEALAIPTIYAGEVSHLKPIQYGLRVLGIVANYKRGKYARLRG